MAQNFPSLRRVTLQNTRNLTDRALMAFFEHCENLSFLEISTLKKDGSMDGTAFDFLRERPRLARKLKTLRVMDNKWFMKPLRELGKEREDLLIQLVRTSEVYDGEMELWGTTIVGVGNRGIAMASSWIGGRMNGLILGFFMKTGGRVRSGSRMGIGGRIRVGGRTRNGGRIGSGCIDTCYFRKCPVEL